MRILPRTVPSMQLGARLVLTLVLLIGWLSLAPATLLAAPVSWVEVTPTELGRQWWDEGSLRRNRAGYLTVLSRFQPPETENGPSIGSLYVMELDCGQGLYRDVSVNGLPRWGAAWQLSEGDALSEQVLRQACAAPLS
jgi:hypothetical protein